jgi:A/G-specific adenine glycosylase
MSDLHEPVLQWYDAHARDLPWRAPEATPWGILVSEFMLQQTPVVRVLPVWTTWLATWPTPADLAAQPAGEAVRAWGRLGYPRRALRLHAAAQAIVERHHGQVPASYDALKALPGVGDYTAAAVSSFAYRQRHVVLDTNVRRVLARSVSGVEFPPTAVTRAERELATGLLPDEQAVAANWAVAVMELGALVCTATNPRCDACPIADRCAWLAAGRPAHDGPARKVQTYDGTDRQCRGRLLAVVRAADTSVDSAQLDAVWPDPTQRDRALASLIADGLVVRSGDRYALPG